MIFGAKNSSQALPNQPLFESIDDQPKSKKEVKSQQLEGQEKPVYAYEKNRTDTHQMPLNFYLKKK
jgi:hypothetical protein